MNSDAPVTRREVLKAGMGLAALSVLDACGGGNGSDASNIVRYAVHPAIGVARRARDASASIVWSHARRCSLRRRPMPTPRRWSRPFVMDGGTPRVFLMRRAS